MNREFNYTREINHELFKKAENHLFRTIPRKNKENVKTKTV
jgi:hypothetical protein